MSGLDENDHKLQINPLIQKLSTSADPTSPLVSLSGYVGPAPSDRFRLYARLDLGEYIEGPSTAIRLVVKHCEDHADCVEILVAHDTKLTHVRTRRVRADELKRSSDCSTPGFLAALSAENCDKVRDLVFRIDTLLRAIDAGILADVPNEFYFGLLEIKSDLEKIERENC